MKKTKLNIGIHYILMLVLTSALIVTLSYGWYVSNTKVSANGITATSKSNDVKIVNHAIYLKTNDVMPPYPDKIKNEIGGLLFNDVIYYTISIKSMNIKTKNITIEAMDIDGGEFFTIKCDRLFLGNESHIEIPAGEYHTTIRKKVEKVTPRETTNDYVVEEVVYNLYTEENDNDIPKDGNTLLSSGEFYNVDPDGNYLADITGKAHYRVYIYQKNNERYNTCDLYTIKLSEVFLGSSYTKNEITTEVDSIYTTPSSFIRGNMLLDRLERKTICRYNSWTPKAVDDIITFRFEIVFNMERINTNAPRINQSNISNKNFIMNNIIVRSEEVA